MHCSRLQPLHCLFPASSFPYCSFISRVTASLPSGCLFTFPSRRRAAWLIAFVPRRASVQRHCVFMLPPFCLKMTHMLKLCHKVDVVFFPSLFVPLYFLPHFYLVCNRLCAVTIAALCAPTMSIADGPFNYRARRPHVSWCLQKAAGEAAIFSAFHRRRLTTPRGRRLERRLVTLRHQIRREWRRTG